MLDITLLGTGGMMPLPNRFLTSLFVRFNGHGLLIDCGEGTQVAMRKAGCSAYDVNTILLTHFHADHVSGLTGLLLTMGNADRAEPVVLAGPHGVERVLAAVRVIAPELPFEVIPREIDAAGEELFFDGMRVTAFKVHHNMPCFGYTIEVDRQGRFDPEAAKARGIPLMLWKHLQKGETVTEEGVAYTPDMVLGPPRKGLKAVYCTDTRPCAVIEAQVRGADLAILEGMYGEADKQEKAKQYKHMTMQEAAKIAAKAQPKELWLTHTSPSCVRADCFADEIRKIFPNTVFPKDGQSVSLRFAEE